MLGGLGLGFVPGMPDVQLDPDVVLLIFLPPLLYGAAFFTSLRDLRANARAISLLAIPWWPRRWSRSRCSRTM